MKKLSICLCAQIYALSTLYADEKMAQNPQSVSLEPIAVVATSGENLVDALKINVRNATLIKDIMRDIPGVYIGGTNGLNQKIYIRGVNERGLNITIDGARQRGNAFHHDGDLYLDADIIKSVDVGLGVNSIVGAAGALGGSVAFKTVDASDLLEDGENFGGKIKGGYASNNQEWQQSLTLYGRAFESVDLLGYIGHRGYERGKDAKNDKIGGKGNDTNYMFKFGADIGDYSKLRLSTEHFKTHGDYPLRAEWPSLGDLLDTEFIRKTHTLNFTSNPNDYLNLDFNAYYTDHEIKTMKNGVKTYGTKLINKTKFGDENFSQTFVYGFDYYNMQSYNKNNSLPNDKGQNLSLFIEDQIRSNGFTFTPGIRYDRYTLNTMGGKIIGMKRICDRRGCRLAPLSSKERVKYTWHKFSPGVSLDYQFDMGLGLWASWAKVFKGPDPIESMRIQNSSVQTTTTNSDLKPETGDVWEFGARYKTEISDNQSINLSAKYFVNQYENLISEMGVPGRVEIQRINGGKANVKGAEIAARYNITDFSFGASWSKAKTKYKDGAKQGYGYVLAYSDAGDKYTFNAEYYANAIDTLFGYNLVAFNKIHTKNGLNSEFNKPGYAVSDIYATWVPNSGKYSGLEINVGIYNLFNKSYWSHSQRSAGNTNGGMIDWEPGRNIKANVSYKF